MGGGVSAPILIRKVEPEYTEEARAAKYQGTVMLYADISPEGIATNIKFCIASAWDWTKRPLKP